MAALQFKARNFPDPKRRLGAAWRIANYIYDASGDGEISRGSIEARPSLSRDLRVHSLKNGEINAAIFLIHNDLPRGHLKPALARFKHELFQKGFLTSRFRESLSKHFGREMEFPPVVVV